MNTATTGTIVVNTAARFLYLIMSGTTAMRYAVGVGRDGFQWGGIHRITRKQEWPDWTPLAEMIVCQPYLPRFMAGGPGNPMGARALYIGIPFTASTASTRPKQSATLYRPDVLGWLIAKH